MGWMAKTIIWVCPFVVVACIFLVIQVITGKSFFTMAKNYQIRCRKCGHTRDLSKTGAYRIGGRSYKIGFCRTCRRPSMLSLSLIHI